MVPDGVGEENPAFDVTPASMLPLSSQKKESRAQFTQIHIRTSRPQRPRCIPRDRITRPDCRDGVVRIPLFSVKLVKPETYFLFSCHNPEDRVEVNGNSIVLD
jgi:hypothetical protein